MFQSGLPKNFVLSYMTPEGESFPLNSPEDFEALQSKQYTKPVKVVITEVQEDLEKIEDDQLSEYDMIADPLKAEDLNVIDAVESNQEDDMERLPKEEEEVEKREMKDILDEITEEVSKINVMPKVEKLEGEIPQEEQVRRIVRETLAEQMPFIISRMKEASLQESLRSAQSDYNAEQRRSLQYNWNQMALYPYYQSVLQSIPDELKVAQSQEEMNSDLPQVSDSNNSQPEEAVKGEKEGVEEEKNEVRSPNLLNKVKKAFVEFPMKAADFVDSLTQKIAGDPYVECEEGRYLKSVVEKVESLKEVFEEADKKELLDFVSKLPKEIPLFQIGDLFAIHKNIE